MKISARIFHGEGNYQLTIRNLVSLGVPVEEINVLVPDADAQSSRLETGETKDVRFFLRGVGSVIASGKRAKALLETLGARAEGDSRNGREEMSSEERRELPLDDFAMYEDALRKRERIVFVLAPLEHQWEKIEAALDECGGKSVHQAREEWWREISERQESAVAEDEAGRDVDDYLFRLGFEVALHPARRGQTFEAARGELREAHPEACDVESFQHGYNSGRTHQEALEERDGSASAT